MLTLNHLLSFSAAALTLTACSTAATPSSTTASAAFSVGSLSSFVDSLVDASGHAKAATYPRTATFKEIYTSMLSSVSDSNITIDGMTVGGFRTALLGKESTFNQLDQAFANLGAYQDSSGYKATATIDRSAILSSLKASLSSLQTKSLSLYNGVGSLPDPVITGSGAIPTPSCDHVDQSDKPNKDAPTPGILWQASGDFPLVANDLLAQVNGKDTLYTGTGAQQGGIQQLRTIVNKTDDGSGGLDYTATTSSDLSPTSYKTVETIDVDSNFNCKSVGVTNP